MKKIALILTTALAVNSFALAEETKQPSTFAKYAKPIAKIGLGLFAGASSAIASHGLANACNYKHIIELILKSSDRELLPLIVQSSIFLSPLVISGLYIKQGIQELCEIKNDNQSDNLEE